MTARRGWYIAGLVAAILALVLSVGAAVALLTPGTTWWGAPASSVEGWRRGLAGGGMMGQRQGGMMGDWDEQGNASVSAEQAIASAKAWLAAHEPGATLGEPVRVPMGYMFPVTMDGVALGTVMVNDDTGQLVWMGAVQPSPSAS